MKVAVKVLIFLISLITLVNSKNIYVSQQRGDDSNTGDLGSPFRTFQKGNQVAADGDTIFLEIGAYTFGQTITKKIKVAGVKENGKYPIVNGGWTIESGSLYVQNLNLESPSTVLFNIKSKIEEFTLTDFSISKTYSYAIDIPNCEGHVKIDNGIIADSPAGIRINGCTREISITGIEIEKMGNTIEIGTVSKRTPRIVFSRNTIKTLKGRVTIQNADKLEITGFELVGSENSNYRGGLNIATVKELTINNIKVSDSETGVFITSCSGSITGGQFNNIKRKSEPLHGSALSIVSNSNFKVNQVTVTNSYSVYGGALYCESSTLDINDSKFQNNKAGTSAGSLYFGNCQTRLRGVEMSNNNATHGGGFYCNQGNLNIFSGKIENNAAGNGGAGQCGNNCAFFIDGAVIRGNTQQGPSTCPGIPNTKK